MMRPTGRLRLVSRFLASHQGSGLAFLVGISVLAVAVVVSGFAWLLDSNTRWTRAAQRNNGNVVGDLFEKAIEYGFVSYLPGDESLRILTLREAENQKLLVTRKPNLPHPEVIMRLLWKPRGPGFAIRGQVQQYNNHRLVAAVRDSSGRLVDCPKGLATSADCRKSLWLARLAPIAGLQASDTTANIWSQSTPAAGARDGAAFRYLASRLSGNEPDVSLFGRLALAQLPNFRDWTSLAGPELIRRRVAFTRLPALAATSTLSGAYHVDVIGAAIRLQPPVADRASVQSFCLSKTGPTMTDCDSANAKGSPIASRLSFDTLQAGGLQSISVVPVQVPGLAAGERASKFRIGKPDAPSRRSGFRSYALTENIRLDCYARLSGARICHLLWRESRRRKYLVERDRTDLFDSAVAGLRTEAVAEAENAASGNVDTEGNHPAWLVQTGTDGQLEATAEARRLGLDGVLGHSSRQVGSYLSVLAAPPEGLDTSNLELQISRKIQRIAAQRFRELLIDKTGFGNLATGVPDEFDDVRRAGLVVLDISEPEREGAILAAVGYPFYDGGLSDWDLRAIQKVAPSRDPLASHAWAAIDSRYMPGSSMKLVSALSMIDLATGVTGAAKPGTRELLLNSIRGASNRFYRESFDVNLARRQTSVRKSGVGDPEDTFPVTDAGGRAPLTRANELPADVCATGRDSSFDGDSRLFGLCEGIVLSSNIWFARTALRANRGAIAAMHDGRFDTGAMPAQALTLQRLMPPEGLPLLRVLSAEAESVLRADPIVLGSEPTPQQVPALPELEIAINAYGQNVQASPLTMAAVAGSIATGRIVSPFLARDRDVVDDAPLLYGPGTAGEELLNLLRDSAYWVVNAEKGTAYDTFHVTIPGAASVAPFVYGKTGTPTLAGPTVPEDGGPVEGSWFVGWTMQDRWPRARYPRYAIACGISHVTQGGSTVCAGLVARIVVDLRTLGQ